MRHIYFGAAEFTILTGADGKPWLVVKELYDYLKRGWDTLLRKVGGLTEKWHFFIMPKVKISFEYLNF